MGVNGIYGLSGSGLDVESMVKVGMLSKQNEYDKMQQKFTKNEWKKSEFLSLYGEVQTFNSSTLSQYKLSSNMNARSATSTNSSIVTASANANAAPMTHYVEVNKLASSAYLIGTKMDRQNDNPDRKNQLQTLLFESIARDTDGKFYVNDNSGTKFDANDVAFSFTLNDGINGMAASSNAKAVTAYASPGAATGEHTVVVEDLAAPPDSIQGGIIAGLKEDSKIADFLSNLASSMNINASQLQAMSTNYTQAFAFTFGDGVNSTKIAFSFADLVNPDTTVASFLDNLNSQFEEAGLTIHANYTAAADGTGGSLSISNSEVGSKHQVEISILSSDINSDVGVRPMMGLASALFGNTGITDDWQNNITTNSVVDDDGNTALKVSYTLSGTDATVKIDGTNVNFDGNTYVDRDNGITYIAHAVTAGTEDSDVKITNQGAAKVEVTYKQLFDGFTFSDLTSKINSLGTNVRASYDSVQDRFYFYNKESGSKNNITFTIANDNGTNALGTNTVNFFDRLGLKQSSNGEIEDTNLIFETGKSTTQAGSDALVKIDGVDYPPLDSNKTTINGVTYNFQNVTEPNSKITVNVTQDTDAIVNKVKSFVDDYNALLTKLYKWYDEKPNSDYKPLTASQKDAMKDEQIEKWEEKAKAGLLYHDKTLGNLITEIRSAVTSKVDGISGKYNSIFSIGISTTGLKGQLTIDTDKLNAALAEDPDAVYNIFAKLDGGEKSLAYENPDGKIVWLKEGTTVPAGYKEHLGSDGKQMTKTEERSSYNGIAQRLGDVFMAGMKNIKTVSGTTAEITEDSELNNLLRELQTKMSNFRKMMQAFETKLYKKYDAMESSLALLGAQLNYVTNAFQ